MEVIIVADPDPDAAAQVAADIIDRLIARNPKAVLGLATPARPTNKRSPQSAASTSNFVADGHVGFNEPISSLGSRTRVKTLNEQTRSDNARFFDTIADVPRHVITQGIATILEARHLVLVAIGANKAHPIARAVEGPITAMIPASAMQLHPHATVIVDEPAAADLTLADYYRYTHRSKPEWQTP